MSYNIIAIESQYEWSKIYQELYDESIINKNNKSNNIHLIGLDCEYISSSGYPESYKNCTKWVKKENMENKIAVCKLQISTDKTSYVIDLCQLGNGLPKTLVEILQADNWVKMGVGVSNDIIYLSKNYEIGHCGGVFDVRTFAILANFPNPSLDEIYTKIVDGTSYGKIQNKEGDWSKPLTIQQLKYAGHDAYMSYIVGKYFLDKFIKLDKKDKLFVETKEETKYSMDISPMSLKVDCTEENYIGFLQEWVQKKNYPLPYYREIKKPVNSKEDFSFWMECKIIDDDNNTLVECVDGNNSKKTLRKKLAYQVLTKLNLI
jgi:hypothetical protein